MALPVFALLPLLALELGLGLVLLLLNWLEGPLAGTGLHPERLGQLRGGVLGDFRFGDVWLVLHLNRYINNAENAFPITNKLHLC